MLGRAERCWLVEAGGCEVHVALDGAIGAELRDLRGRGASADGDMAAHGAESSAWRCCFLGFSSRTMTSTESVSQYDDERSRDDRCERWVSSSSAGSVSTRRSHTKSERPKAEAVGAREHVVARELAHEVGGSVTVVDAFVRMRRWSWRRRVVVLVGEKWQ